MNILPLALLLATADPDDGLSKKMLPIYVKEAETYSIAAGSDAKGALELKKEPVFEWVNPARNTQQGAVFLWLRDGRPAALGCFFSAPRPKWASRVARFTVPNQASASRRGTPSQSGTWWMVTAPFVRTCSSTSGA